VKNLNSISIIDICEKAVNFGLECGADDIEVFSSVEKTINSSIESNAVKTVTSHQLQGLGIRVIKSGSLGFASTNSYDVIDIKNTISKALKIASMVPSDQFNKLPESKSSSLVTKLYDPHVEEFKIEDAFEKTSNMILTTKETDQRISIDSGGFSSSIGDSILINSNGIKAEEKESLFSWNIMGMASNGVDVSNFDVQYGGSRSLKDISLSQSIEEFANNVTSSLGSNKIESFKGDVILSPEASLDVLIEPIIHLVNSKNVQKGLSKFKNKLNDSISSELLTVFDDGTINGGLMSSNFDREGVPHKKTIIIDSGILKSYLYNNYSANKDQLQSTGNASGSYRSIPSISPTNLMLEPGSSKLSQIITSLSKGILVTRFSGNVNPISGEFSGVVKGGKYIENGSIKYPIKECLISGNIFDLLIGLNDISKENKRLFGFTLPYLHVNNVSITAG